MAFAKLAYERIPLSVGMHPHIFFDRLKGEYACLLESGKGGRYSYIGYDPFLITWSAAGSAQMIKRKDFFNLKKSAVGQIIESNDSFEVTRLLKQFELKGDCPVPFCGGAVGYISYDYGCGFTGVEQKVFDDLKMPDYYFSFFDKVVAFDHQENFVYRIAIAESDMAAERKLKEIDYDLEYDLPLQRKGSVGELVSNISKDVYVKKVDELKKLLIDGETYQVNFSQRFSADCSYDPWNVYKKLAVKNPSPFACYLDYPDFKVVSSSPELLLRIRDERIETWPIKGTIPRGKNEAEDQKNIKMLMASKKDDAELSMIVDLSRNDLGKVCEIGSVKVDAHRDIEKYSHVIHTVSRVSGKLSKNKGFDDCLRALFPGGSITGCPKKRTMEIIDKFEDYKRGIYTGSAGFISFSGDADLNILIRTMLFMDNKVYFNAGGGIVVDSNAEKEYEESVDKAKAMIESLQ